ncbi:MAG: alpha/beta hydrolase [Burkholderiales bacterium]|nr:alpha/beta hydrolase [Burkholderiales bacterium]
MLKKVEAGVLSVAYEDNGAADGTPVLLLHGFPYDVHAYDDVTLLLAAAGCRVIAPYLRGYGPTRFLSPDTPRSGQQAVLGHDLLAFMDALRIQRAVLAGYDWGGRAACIAAALWPERVSGLVTGGGYNIQYIPGAMQPQAPVIEHQLWYQYYFHGERGRVGLEQNRRELCRYIWQIWSPSWHFDEMTYERTAAAFDNPDFVAVVIHSYRHRFALVPGDPAVEATERRLTERPPIRVPTVVLHGGNSGFTLWASPEHEQQSFAGSYVRRLLPAAGHNLPQEAPGDFAAAVLSLVHDGGTMDRPAVGQSGN